MNMLGIPSRTIDIDFATEIIFKGLTIYGVVERTFIPFGLHHVWNVPFFFEAGS